jgi:intein/homing endonuclease
MAQQNNLFNNLKRLFSTDVVIRNVGGDNLKIIDVNKIQTTGKLQTNSLVDRFNRIYTNSQTSLYGRQSNFNYQYLRPSLYSDYDSMDTDAIIASSLDIIADESTLKNDMGEVLSIKSSDEEVQKVLYNLFYDVLNIEFNLWPWVRNMCKYGDFFLKLEIAEKFGVYNVIPYTAFHIERVEGPDEEEGQITKFRFDPEGIASTSYGFYNVPNQDSDRGITFDNYEMAHFRLLTDVNFLPYGRCLAPESRIYTENSYKEIQDIKKGDKVWTFNLTTEKYELAEVLNTTNSGIKNIFSVKTSHSEVRGSDNHPILVWDILNNEPKYEQIKNLKVGDYVVHCNNPERSKIENSNIELYKIKSITEELPEETYDIQVSKNSNFISDGIIVHNSYIEPARKLFKQYSLMEDAMLMHRIVRAPEKRIHYMNIGSIPPNEVEAFMEQTVSKMKRTPHIDEESGEYNLKYNLENILEDYYIPVRGNDTSTKIETLNGLQWDGIEDVKYLREKLFAALKIPKAFMGYDEDTDGKATLASQDMRFARTIERIQRIITSELYKIAVIHLYSQGYRKDQLNNFELSLTNPSIIYDQERVELLKSKVELATNAVESGIFPTDWVYNNIFNLSEEEYNEFRDLIDEDAKRKFKTGQIENEGNDPYESGKTYGTPHDLASLYGRDRFANSGNVPDGYDETSPKKGRPKEKSTNINTQDNNFGKDRLGAQGTKNDYNDNGRLNPNANNNKNTLSLETKYRDMIKSLSKSKKGVINETSGSFLDESNLKE